MNQYTVDSLCSSPNWANTYVVYNNSHCIIIDPSSDIRFIEKMIGENTLDAILLTHGHYDHFKEIENLLDKHNVPCYMHKNAYNKIINSKLSYATMFGCKKEINLSIEKVIFIHDQSIIELPNFIIKVLYTPGHTDCSVVYLLDNLMFSGDTLFKESVGRTDLITGNSILLKRSLDTLKHLVNHQDYIVYPGHDEETTLINEIKNNYYLK